MWENELEGIKRNFEGMKLLLLSSLMAASIYYLFAVGQTVC